MKLFSSALHYTVVLLLIALAFGQLLTSSLYIHAAKELTISSIAVSTVCLAPSWDCAELEEE